MSDLTFKVRVISPQRILFEGDTTMIIAPGQEGDLGILKNHMPIVVALRQGSVCVMNGNQKETFDIQGGYLDMRDNFCTVLAS
jgi:F-type H+-transporting ATPase subunit epsilon